MFLVFITLRPHLHKGLFINKRLPLFESPVSGDNGNPSVVDVVVDVVVVVVVAVVVVVVVVVVEVVVVVVVVVDVDVVVCVVDVSESLLLSRSAKALPSFGLGTGP